MAAATLLAVEGKVRAAKDETELVHLIANELRKLVSGRQVVVLRLKGGDALEAVCVSSIAVIDRETPFIRWVEGMVRGVRAEFGDGEGIAFDLPAFVDATAAETTGYPFPHFVWQPLRLVSGEAFAGVLISRERPWSEQDRRLIAREADVFGGIWQALYGSRQLRPRPGFTRRHKLLACAAAVGVALCPVPMTTLAPVEIIAANPQRVTAPLDGVVKEILVEPNRPVTKGQPLVKFDETTLRNSFLVAEREMNVAQARFDRLNQASFVDEKARHGVAEAGAELALKTRERDYAVELLGRTLVLAERDGILVYADKERWLGRPVKTGERMMQIVSPQDIAARIELPVADAIVLEKGAGVRLFLDAAPLNAVSARLVSEGYQAEPNSTQQLVYRLHAAIDAGNERLRIGARGTAQLSGRYVPLSFYLLRRPISTLRQSIGL